MGIPTFVVWYVRGCASGAITIGECGPVWELIVIALLLLAAFLALVHLPIRSSSGNQTS